MRPMNYLGLFLVTCGLLAVVYGGFSYTRDSSALQVGSVTLSVKKQETLHVPLWAGLASIVAGGLLLARRRQ